MSQGWRVVRCTAEPVLLKNGAGYLSWVVGARAMDTLPIPHSTAGEGTEVACANMSQHAPASQNPLQVESKDWQERTCPSVQCPL